jgi:hypothetical protein
MLVVNRVRLQLKVEGNSTTDGAIFECFLASGLLNDDSGLAPQMFIADFDKNLERYRIEGSRVFTYDVPDGIKRFPQRQACVIDKSVIGGLEIAEPSKTGG